MLYTNPVILAGQSHLVHVGECWLDVKAGYIRCVRLYSSNNTDLCTFCVLCASLNCAETELVLSCVAKVFWSSGKLGGRIQPSMPS